MTHLQQFGAVKTSTPATPLAHPPDADRDGPLSFNQSAHLALEWLAHLRGKPHVSTPMLLAMMFEGAVNARAIEEGLNEIVRRHEVLRTSVPDPRRLSRPAEAALVAALTRHGVAHDGLFTPRIWPEARLSLSVERMPGGARADDIDERARRLLAQPFDYASPPLMRALLLTQPDERRLLLVTFHHLVADIWSVGVVGRELLRLYDLRAGGRSFDELPPPALQYREFARQERERFRSIPEALVAYWKAHWAAYGHAQITPRDLPRPRPETPADERVPGHQSRSLDAARVDALRALARKCRVTTYMLGLSAMALVFHAYTRRTALAWWGYCSNRASAEREGLIGWVAHGWMFGVTVDPDASAAALIRRVRDRVYDMYDHEEVPVQIWWRILQEHRLADLDAFGEQFVSYDAFVAERDERVTLADGVTCGPAPRSLLKGAAWPSLGLFSSEGPRSLVFDCRYSSARCGAGSIAAFLDDLDTALGLMAAEPDAAVSSLAARLAR